MSLTYILIDFENVQPTAADMSLIRGPDYRVRLFHGPHQNKFDAEMVKALQPVGVYLEYFASAEARMRWTFILRSVSGVSFKRVNPPWQSA